MADSQRHYISRQQILNLESAFSQVQREINLKPKHPRQGEFEDIVMGKGGIKAKTAVDILLDDTDCNGVFKKFLFSGLCGWAIDPQDETVTLQYLGLEAKNHFLRSEFLFETDAENYTAGLDAICRYTLTGEDFHPDIFFPLGGNENTLFSGSVYDIENYVAADAAAIKTLAYLCGILCHMFHFSDGSNIKHTPSKNRLLKFLDLAHTELKKRPVGEQGDFPNFLQRKSKFNEIWSRNKESIALLFAAADVRVKRGSTLLDALLSAEVDSDRDLGRLEEWLGKAAFFYTSYLSRLGAAGQSSLMERSPKQSHRNIFAYLRSSAWKSLSRVRHC